MKLPITKLDMWYSNSSNQHHRTFKVGDEVIYYSKSSPSQFDYKCVTTHDRRYKEEFEGIGIVWWFNRFEDE
jgi:hypothetical protein